MREAALQLLFLVVCIGLVGGGAITVGIAAICEVHDRWKARRERR